MEINKQERTFPDREKFHHAASRQAYEYVKLFLNDVGYSLRHYEALPAFLAACANGLCPILLRSHGKRQPIENNKKYQDIMQIFQGIAVELQKYSLRSTLFLVC